MPVRGHRMKVVWAGPVFSGCALEGQEGAEKGGRFMFLRRFCFCVVRIADGLVWAGVGWLGWAWLGWAGLGRAGLGWVALGWAKVGRLCWAGLGWAGLGWLQDSETQRHGGPKTAKNGAVSRPKTAPLNPITQSLWQRFATPRLGWAGRLSSANLNWAGLGWAGLRSANGPKINVPKRQNAAARRPQTGQKRPKNGALGWAVPRYAAP